MLDRITREMDLSTIIEYLFNIMDKILLEIVALQQYLPSRVQPGAITAFRWP